MASGVISPSQIAGRFTVADIYAAREELARRKLATSIPALIDLRQPARYKGGVGGRGSGKSHDFAELLILYMLLDPDLFAVCIREIQKSLAMSAKKLLEGKIVQWQLEHCFEVQQSVIKRRGGKGIAIFAGMQDHTADSIKSLEGAKVAWVEEAQSLSHRSMALLTPTIRAPGSELWFSWNPRFRSDAVEQLLRARGGNRPDAIEHPELPRSEVQIVRKANYTDNPHLPPELRAEADYARLNTPDTYDHIWLGGFEGMGSKVVIPPAHVEAAIGLCEFLGITATGKKYSALDVAGGEEGGDENCWVGRHGIELQAMDAWNGLDTSATTDRAIRLTREFGADELDYDSVSVGEGVTGHWAALGRRGEQPNGLQLVPWNAGSSVLEPDQRVEPSNPRSPLNKDQYMNLKAQGWFHLRKRFENAYAARNGRPYDPELLISIRPDLPGLAKLQDELSQPQHKPSATGKTMVDKQPDNAPSPNRADPVMMAYFPIPVQGYDWGSIL